MAANTDTAEGRESTKQRRVKLVNADEDKIAHLPESYLANSNKEELCLEYVRNFNGKFRVLHPKRDSLFLIARNEFGVQKFVCSTIRPTLLPSKEVYTLEEAAAFVANYLHYEPLESPTEPPSCLPSPSQVLEWGCGDSFDFAVLLCSFLLGAGYDAFVVLGTAPRHITLRDQSRIECPILVAEAKSAASAAAKAAKEEAEAEAKKPTKYLLPAKEPTWSAFLKSEQKAEVKAVEDWLPEDKEAPRPAPHDPLQGRRKHCWVLVRGGKRGAEGFRFVEPTTGALYDAAESPYESVECMWNARNLHVNLQACPLDRLSFDTLDPSKWEYVFAEPAAQLAEKEALRELLAEQEQAAPAEDGPAKSSGKGPGQSSGRGEAKEDESKQGDDILDLPPSWVGRLRLTRGKLLLKFPPTGSRTTLYNKSKLESFSAHPLGVVERLTLYVDVAQTVVHECRETFSNRKDKLRQRIRWPLEGKSRDAFEPGRAGGLKSLTEWPARRELEYFSSARADGLWRREEDFGRKIVERFEGRGDCMAVRSASVVEERTVKGAKQAWVLPTGGLSGGDFDLVVNKISVKYANLKVSKRTFYLSEGRIREVAALQAGRVSADEAVFFKADPVDEAGAAAAAHEREALAGVKRAAGEAAELLKARRREEADVRLTPHVFEAKPPPEERGHDDKALPDASDGPAVDYLTPFLGSAADAKTLTKEDAQRVRDACLKSLKERLLERANIIQNRLNDQNGRLAKRQATFQRNASGDPAAEEEFEKFCADAMFTIGILEQRLVAHEESALKKYHALDERISSDPRMAALHM